MKLSANHRPLLLTLAMERLHLVNEQLSSATRGVMVNVSANTE